MSRPGIRRGTHHQQDPIIAVLGPWFFSTHTSDIGTNVAAMAANGIDVQLVSAVEAVNNDPPAGNRALLAELEKLGENSGGRRIFGLVVLDPRAIGEAERDFDELMGSGRFVGAKIHTAYSHTPAGSGVMKDALTMLAERNLPVLVHTWGDEIVGLAENVAAVPGARTIAGHMGGPAWRLAPEAAKITDRLWFEPCWSTPETGRIRWFVDRAGTDRLLFGTDSTLIDPAVAIGAIAEADLSADERERVYSANALELFDLPASVG